MKFSIHSNIGRKRTSNQDFADYFINKSQQVLFVLCDGVGGHQAGDVASRLSTEYFGELFLVEDYLAAEHFEAWVQKSIENVNQRILDLSSQEDKYYGMGTTLVLGLMIDQRLYYSHVGDSRAYLYRHQQLQQLTDDHSLVNELVKNGEISHSEAFNHPRRNIITQSIGSQANILPEIGFIELAADDIILMCSDGLSDMLTLSQIEDLFKAEQDLVALNQRLIQAANEAGGFDNITSILISDPLNAEVGAIDKGGDY